MAYYNNKIDCNIIPILFTANGVLEGKKGSVVLQETKERWPKAYFVSRILELKPGECLQY